MTKSKTGPARFWCTKCNESLGKFEQRLGRHAGVCERKVIRVYPGDLHYKTAKRKLSERVGQPRKDKTRQIPTPTHESKGKCSFCNTKLDKFNDCPKLGCTRNETMVELFDMLSRR